MDKIQDLLAGKSVNEPPEILQIKNYVKQKFNSSCEVQAGDHQIKISVSNAALANQLRNELVDIRTLIHTDKRLIIFIR